MPVATKTNPTSLAATLTQASLIAGIRDALVAAGFPAPLKQYTVSTDMFVLWQLVFDAAKPLGTIYYRLKLSSTLVASHTVGTGWVDASNSLSNAPSDVHATSFSASLGVTFTTFQSSEICLALCTQGATMQFNAGWLRLADSPQYDEIAYPKIFIAGSNNFSSLTTTSITPYGITTSFTTSLNNASMADADSYYGQRSLLGPFWLWGPSNTGIIAMSGPELGMGANNSLSFGSLQNPPGTTESWFVTRSGAGTMVIRIA